MHSGQKGSTHLMTTVPRGTGVILDKKTNKIHRRNGPPLLHEKALKIRVKG